MRYYLGLDIGTSNAKAAIFDDKFTNLYSSEKSIETFHPQNGYSEQDPDEIFEKVTDLLIDAFQFAGKAKISIHSLGISAAMHSFLPVDRFFKPFNNAIIWSDLRSIELAKALKQSEFLADEWNVPIHPMLPLAKWQWWKEHHGTAKVNKLLSIKDYLIYKWTGQCFTDLSTASATGFFNIKSFDWDDRLLESLGLSKESLPEIKPTTFEIDNWNKEIPDRVGQKLPKLILGSTDGCLANLAAGIKSGKQASLTIGTSAALRTTVIKKNDLEKGLFCYPITDKYIVKGGALNNGGNVVEWLRKTFFEGVDFWSMVNEALLNVPPGSEGLLFLPYLHGERAPFWDPEKKGAYLGLTHYHTKEHFIKSTIEGVVFALRHVLSLLDKKGEIESVIVDGGFVKSASWVQLVSDVLGKKLLVPSHSYGAALGAAMLAKIADRDGSIENVLDELDANYTEIVPNLTATKEYDKLFSIYLNYVM